MSTFVGILIVAFAVVWLAAQHFHAADPAVSAESATSEKPPFVDPLPSEIRKLQMELGLGRVSYEYGRSAFIKYGHEFSLYAMDDFGFAWADSFQDLIEAARRQHVLYLDRPRKEAAETAERKRREAERAKAWDELEKER